MQSERARARYGALLCSCLPHACVRDLINSVCVRGLRVRPRATVVNLCDYINNPLLLSIPNKLNLGGTLRTTNYVL
jgi:hypothetical protein